MAVIFIKGPPDRDLCLTPYAPRKFDMIVEVKVKKGELEKVVWNTNTRLEGGAGDAAPRWDVVERSPEQGRRKRTLQDAASSALSAFPLADIDGGGTLRFNGKEAARYDADTTEWQSVAGVHHPPVHLLGGLAEEGEGGQCADVPMMGTGAGRRLRPAKHEHRDHDMERMRSSTCT